MQERRSQNAPQSAEVAISGTCRHGTEDSSLMLSDRNEIKAYDEHDADSMDMNSNYINGTDDTDINNELVESFTKLGDLKNQEKALDDWYSTMSDQLEQEQLKLKENFKEMKLKILQQKQYYLKTSQEYLNNFSNSSTLENSKLHHSIADTNYDKENGHRGIPLAVKENLTSTATNNLLPYQITKQAMQYSQTSQVDVGSLDSFGEMGIGVSNEHSPSTPTKMAVRSESQQRKAAHMKHQYMLDGLETSGYTNSISCSTPALSERLKMNGEKEFREDIFKHSRKPAVLKVKLKSQLFFLPFNSIWQAINFLLQNFSQIPLS